MGRTILTNHPVLYSMMINMKETMNYKSCSLSNSVASNNFFPTLFVITTVSSPSCSSHHLPK